MKLPVALPVRRRTTPVISRSIEIPVALTGGRLTDAEGRL
jgi:hypothetical protein